MAKTRRGLSGWCAATVLVSAFLLFLVQPMISKMILPWFGGSPAVWTTCMLFFQVFLLAGYAYAHFLDRLPSTRSQGTLHLILLVAALFVLPITPGVAWKPIGSDQPQWHILLLLTVCVGLPYFLLASSAPLIQAWYRAAHEGRSPYRFYALSNVGSLGALLAYPFLLEPRLTTSTQGALWSWGFAGFVILAGILSLVLARMDLRPSDWTTTQDATSSTVATSTRPRLLQFGLWLFLPAFGSMTLLAVTNHICQDVAVVPFLWIAPLALYLLTFIISFDSPRWYLRRTTAIVTMLAIGVVAAIIFGERVDKILTLLHINYTVPEFLDSLKLEVGCYLAVLFLVCMLCHGELVRTRPSPQYLTSFYLMVALGGALGGAFVALVCPVVFATYVESNLVLVGGFLLGVAVLANWWWSARRTTTGRIGLALAATVCAVAGGLVAYQLRTGETSSDSKTVVACRNFYGVLSVLQEGDPGSETERRLLYNGRILHGVQFLSPDRQDEATTYYNADSGVGLTLTNFDRVGAMRVGVVGLGSGTLATYGRPGDVYRFYEINPQVVELSQTYFTFVKDSQAKVEIVLGDARLSMERELNDGKPQKYDVLALDAFSGDAIPAHLLTVEAFGIYLKQVRPDGVIAVHTSNRYLDLCPIVALLAKHYDLQVVTIEADDEGGVGDSSSEWMLVTRNTAFLDSVAIEEVSEPVDVPGPDIHVWTDHFSNLYQILQ